MTDDRLRVDWCSTAAARFAVENWHYSKTMPTAKTVRCGVWWGDEFRGAVVFGMACRNGHKMFRLKDTEVCELARVALDQHPEFTVTAVMSRALKLLRQQCPGIRIIVSFADPAEGHIGRIYQASNWIYCGRSAPARALMLNGQKLHRRAYTGVNHGRARMPIPPGAVWVATPPKFRYVMPLDRRARRLVERMRKPYPQPADARAAGPRHQPGETVRPHPSASTTQQGE